MKRHNAQRVAVLVDGANIFMSAKSKGMKPNYGAIMEVINHRQIVRAIMYNVINEFVDQSRFFKAMEHLGYEVRAKAPKIFPDGTRKADWDMQIAIDALSLADKVDVVVLLTGDTDFIPLVHALHAKGVKVECLAVAGSVGKYLIDVVDEFTEIDKSLMQAWTEKKVHEREA